ncbi:MAG: glycoside hydrolase family 88 protein [Alphaproteobacteria bacterium]|nr:glycoside hydrolase family 88 protein [Alphaproteobacteria bacterium]MBU1559614.1 glycoside hydrolase family 88 protein [Alphaproteobacteria bacterium]MBU2304387.1 glycoside hydrolase family 88 protein [Alphaproteobacteria bacterium]MBU2367172.1 glycoside hydrolase family 88 protein [Alphaproteobacteria bacterium]
MNLRSLGDVGESKKLWLAGAIDQAVRRVKKIDSGVIDFPHITEQKKWRFTPDGVWTGGFWAGLLWLAYEHDGDKNSLARAIHFTDRLLLRADDTNNHDLGFMFVPSAIKGWQLQGNEEYRLAAMRAARALAGQYNQSAGFIPGWGFFGGEDWSGNVLVDTLMNLPLIVWAVQQGGDPALLEVVRGHTDKNLRHVMRTDGSVYHMFRFSPETGAPIAGDTYQGHGPETTWSRGQAWAIGGLAMLAQMLPDLEYLAASERAAAYFLKHLPDDNVPPWDFQAPAYLPYKDASAGAIAAFGLIKLFDATGKREYLDAAARLLSALAETCANKGEEGGLLLHSTADLPHGLGVDESVMYGDYYYLKALLRLQQRLDQGTL